MELNLVIFEDRKNREDTTCKILGEIARVDRDMMLERRTMGTWDTAGSYTEEPYGCPEVYLQSRDGWEVE